MGELADTASSSSSFISTFSSSASNAFPDPKMAEPSSIADSKIWPPATEHLFIRILIEEQANGNIVNGKMKKNHWQAVTDRFCQAVNKNYDQSQTSQKFKRLRRKYRAFSRLIGMEGMRWDPDTNVVTGSNSAWSNAELLIPRCREFRYKGLANYNLLGRLFKTDMAIGVLQTSSVQPDSSDDDDDVVEISASDMGQGSNPKGKLPMHSNTSSGGKKRKTVDDMEAQMTDAQMSRKTQCEDGDSRKTIESYDPYSVSAVMNILNSMDSMDPLGDQTFCNALRQLEKLKNRQFLVSMEPRRRRSWVEHLASLP